MPRRFYLSGPLTLCILGLTLSGCDASGDPDVGGTLSASEVIVANGGNFSDQNGHLTRYDPASGEASQSGNMAGFILDVIPDDDEHMVLINTFGPGRIDLLDGASLSRVAQWTGFESPRAAVRIDDRIWMSTYTWGSPGHVVTLSSDGVELQKIPVGEVPEGIAYWQQQVIVANNGSLGSGTTISRIPLGTSEATPVETGCDGPRDLFATPSSLVLVCSGKTIYSSDFSEVLASTPGQVVFFHSDLSVLSRIVLPGQARSTNGTRTATFSEATQELFITLSESGQIATIDIPARRLAKTVSVPDQPGLLGLSGVAYDAGRDHLYVGRFPESSAGAFPDFSAAGTVQIIDRNGKLISSFTAGASISSILVP